MRLLKLHIQNFRGIRDLTLELDDVVVLVGENNTGKTAILHALRLCLNNLGPRRRLIFDSFDFHLKDDSAEPTDADPISITLTFSEAAVGDWEQGRIRRLKDIIQVDPTSGLSQVVLRVTCAYNPVELDFVQNWDFLNEAGVPLPGKTEASLSALKREVSFYLLDALRDAGRNFDAKGPFWRPFLKDSHLSPETKSQIETMLQQVNTLVVSSHDSFEQARSRLQKVQEVVPMLAGDVVSIEAVPGRMFDLLTKAQVHIRTMTGAKVPIRRHGEGTQSLAVLMLFSAFLDLDRPGRGPAPDPIVALEEPEAHLHPSAIRALWGTINGLAGQKLISTHSGDLLSQVPVKAIRRLARENDQVRLFSLDPATLGSKHERMLNFHIRRTRGELLFARCWLLGEGETEITLLTEIARHLGIDLERSGVRCVQYRLGASLELFLKVADGFGIKICALTDNDNQGQKDQQHVVQTVPPSVLADVLHVMPEVDIESHLCSAGFGPIYETYLTPQLRQGVTVASSHPDYWKQVLKAIKNVRGYKPTAAMQVILEIQSGAKPVPPLLRTAIEKAVQLAGGP